MKMKAIPNFSGYYIREDGKVFIPNPENKKVVNHKDSDRKNNHVNNLEWVTYAENNRGTLEKGHTKRCKKTGRFTSGLMG